MTVFNVQDEQHASRIARKEIGQRMRNIPLDVLRVDVVEEDDEDEDEGGENEGDDASVDDTPTEATDGGDLVPDVEELIDE
jgi:hypothetical protein